MSKAHRFGIVRTEAAPDGMVDVVFGWIPRGDDRGCLNYGFEISELYPSEIRGPISLNFDADFGGARR